MNFFKSSALVIVDSTVDHYESLIQGIQPGAEVIVLDAAQDSIEQLTQAIAKRTNLDSLHIVSHGRSGEIHLGAIVLNTQTLKQYTQQIRNWAKALAADAEILLYGCEVAAGEAGRAFVQHMSQLTGVNVAASTTLTGSSAQGGNWQLEHVTSGTSSTANPRRVAPLAFQPQTLATYPGVLVVLLSETFREADVTEKPWQFGIGTGTVSANPFLTARATVAPSQNGLPGAGTAIDTPGNGALRLTGVANDQATFAIYDRPLSQADGLTITFDSYAYGGTSFNGSNGDGISFFLVDGSTNATPISTAGAFGGSLGYAQKQVQGIPGIVGGYLGVGYDEFGNYSTSIEDTSLQRPTPAGVATPVRDSIAVRGSAASQYAFLGGTSTLDIGVDNPTATTRDAAQRRTRIDLSPTGILTVRVDLNSDNDFADQGEVVINNLDVKPINGALPSSFKLGFAGSTGAATNIHEVRNLIVRDFVPPDIIIPPPVVDPDTPDDLDDGCLPGRNIKGNSTTNQIRGTRNSDTLIGFAGNDLLQGRGCNDRLDAGRGNDRMFGNGGRDTLKGQQGNDRGLGGRGNDQLLGGLGNDNLDGGDSRDLVEGGRGNDTLKGGKGFDTLDGGRNEDRIDGNIGNDTLRGRQDSDVLRGNGGNDTLSGGLGRDRLGGNRKQDVVLGNRGNDALYGGGGSDTLEGGQGNDRLESNTQADRLIGGSGDDRLIGGGGADVMTGGADRDRFIYSSSQRGVDVITDFQVSRRSAIDLIDLSRVFSRVGYSSTDRFRRYVRLTAVGANTTVRVDFNGNTTGGFQSLVTLNAVSNLTANAFLVS